MTAVRTLLLLGAVAGVCAPAAAADQGKVDAAIRKGADWLKKDVAAAKPDQDPTHGSARAALAGFALLEAGVKPDDPVIVSLANAVREAALSTNRTYTAALGVLFLERLGDPRDVPLVQILGVRLYAGLNVAGGWSYTTCGDVPAAEARRLAAVLYAAAPPRPPKPDAKPAPKLHPEAAVQLNAVRAAILTRGRRGIGEDNSNTQFGVVGLWVASRAGLPVDDAFPVVEAGFLRTQNKADAGWGYSGQDKSTTAMTCAGLLGLTAGKAKRAEAAAPKDTDLPPDDPFLNPKKPAGTPPAAPAVPTTLAAARDAAIKAALQSVGAVLAGTKVGGGLDDLIGQGNMYYVLWSLERVAVALGLETIGDVDWYDWGATRLLAAQKEDGSWPLERYEAQVNTSLALLFLCKANVFRDVSGKVKVKDPGVKELRAGANPIFTAPKVDPPPVRPGSGEPIAVTPTPTLPPVADHPDADRLAAALTAAPDDQWMTVLTGERDAKGVQHTAAIVRAIGKLDGGRKKQARDALADRLTRMTAATLRKMLTDPDPELRRAACLACAMKDDKAHVPDLIDRVTDPSDLVVRAARAGLKSLTGKDHGPDPGAPDEKKVEAAAEWRAWYVSQK